MISNPCKWFISGNKTAEFTYEGGTTLYHFSVHGLPGFNSYMFLNCVFFANSEKHAADVLERMLIAYIAGAKRYKRQDRELQERISGRTEYLEMILVVKDQWEFSIAPTNQFYTVGWASNDTIA